MKSATAANPRPDASNDTRFSDVESASPRRWHRGISVAWQGKGAPKNQGICRYYQEKRGTYYWRVGIKRNGKLYRKDFFDLDYGGEQAAFELAQAWRNHIIATFPRISMAAYCSIQRSNNKTGMTGISRRDRVALKKDDTVYHELSWNAAIPLGNKKTIYRSFSIRRYGEEGAWQRAVAARLEGLEALKKVALRENGQPIPVSSPKKFAQLQARLISPQERRERKAAARLAEREQKAAAALLKRQARAAAAVQAKRDKAEQQALRQQARVQATAASALEKKLAIKTHQKSCRITVKKDSPITSGKYLLDAVIRKLNVKNDAALGRLLELSPAVISKLRHGRLPVGSSVLLRIHDVTGFSIHDLKDWSAFPIRDALRTNPSPNGNAD